MDAELLNLRVLKIKVRDTSSYQCFSLTSWAKSPTSASNSSFAEVASIYNRWGPDTGVMQKLEELVCTCVVPTKFTAEKCTTGKPHIRPWCQKLASTPS